MVPFYRSFESVLDGAESPCAHYAVRADEDASSLWDGFDIKAVPAPPAFLDCKMLSGRESRLGADSSKGVMDSILKAL